MMGERDSQMSSNALEIHSELHQLCDEIEQRMDVMKFRIQKDTNRFIDELKESVQKNFNEELNDTVGNIIQRMTLQEQEASNWVNEIQEITKTIRDSLRVPFSDDNDTRNHLKKCREELGKILRVTEDYKVTIISNSPNDTSTYFLEFVLPTIDYAGVEYFKQTTATVEGSVSSFSPTLATTGTASMPEPTSDGAGTTQKPLPVTNDISTAIPSMPAPSSIPNLPQHIDHQKIPSWTSYMIEATYNVDLLASDGKHIFYVSYGDENHHDLVAYHYLNDREGIDPHRHWKMSKIRDMIWWKRIDAFICATDNAVYTVRYTNGEFKFHSKIRGNWSYIRVAANENELWVWINTNPDDFDGIDIYDHEFNRIRSINFDDGCKRPFTNGSRSFCLTQAMAASICVRTVKREKRFQVNFNGFNMMNFRTVYVDYDYGGTMIRTDGEDQFFMTTGGNKLFMVTPQMNQDCWNLKQNYDALTFVNSDQVVVSGGNRLMKMLIRQR